MASEIDDRAREVYERNWGHHLSQTDGGPRIEGDIVALTRDALDRVPDHDVLAAGFPCQPFSKSGFQRGMEEARGTLFYNILEILQARRPAVVLLENVRNLAGPRHRHEWNVIVHSLRDLGYRVADKPAIFSPHLLPPDLGGAPQFRERVFITGTHVGKDRAWAESDVEPVLANAPVRGWSPDRWSLEEHILLPEGEATRPYLLSPEEIAIIDVWNDFVVRYRESDPSRPLPGFPLWADAFVSKPSIPVGTPPWKEDFLLKNAAFYREHRLVIDGWRKANPLLDSLPPSRRKLEWQAQGSASLWETLMQFRPSGIRAKRPTYAPALVAITQTSVMGPRRRRLTPREAARLQGFQDDFDFGGQSDAATYKQLGNAVAVGVARYVLRSHLERDAADLPLNLRRLLRSVERGELSLVTG